MTAVPAPPATVRFTLNGADVEAITPGSRRLLDVLRVDFGLTGTKEGCGEGECGACAVLIDGELVNSCLVPAGQLDGRDVRTIEGLVEDGRLGPLQRAFLEQGGTQCGMCTPGMLMAAHAALASGRPTGVADIREALAGTLCRCTGYTKIVEAVEAVASGGTTPAGGTIPTGTSPADAATTVAPTTVRAPDQAADTPMTVRAPDWAAGPRLVRPASLADALARLAADPTLRPVAGATDLLVDLAPAGPADAASRARPLLDLSTLDELQGIELAHDELVLGALTTWEELLRSPIVRGALPVLAEVAAVMGAPAIRNRATLGGNCVTASPAGDLLPVLLATDAVLEAIGPLGTRTIPAGGFWTGYRRTALEPGELLSAIRIPLVPGRHVRFRKVGTRRALSIARVLVAVAWRTDPDPPPGAAPWQKVRVALGSVAEVPLRAPRTEALLEGRTPSASLAAAAAREVETEIRPIDDIRAGAAYRRTVTGRVLRRIVLDATT